MKFGYVGHLAYTGQGINTLNIMLGKFYGQKPRRKCRIKIKRSRGILWDAKWIDWPCVWSSGLRKLRNFHKEPCVCGNAKMYSFL